MNQAEYALELLADGAHPFLEKYITGLFTHFRVMNDPAVLEQVQKQCPDNSELLQKNSKAVGTICPSFDKGRLQLTTYTTDLNQAELISRSAISVSDTIFHALGVTDGSEKKVLPFSVGLEKGGK